MCARALNGPVGQIQRCRNAILLLLLIIIIIITNNPKKAQTLNKHRATFSFFGGEKGEGHGDTFD